MTIFLVRHGSAGRRNDSDPSDDRRHLDSAGRSQARRLAALLGRESISQAISSPALRCIETIEPLAEQFEVEVERHSHLYEATPIEHSWGLVEGLARSGVTAVLCSHGDVIPELIRRAQRRGMRVNGESGCSKGSVWTLHWDGHRFDRGTYTPIPKRE